MRRREGYGGIVALVAASLALASCATNSASVETTTLRGFALTQVTFHALQQSAIVAIQSGALKGSAKATVIALIDKGQSLETAAASAAANSDAPTLTTIEQQFNGVLAALGPLVSPPQGK